MSNRSQLKGTVPSFETVSIDIGTEYTPDQRMFAGVDDEVIYNTLPTLRTKQVAEMFFFRSVSWLRWQEQAVHAHPDDESMMVSHFIDRYTGQKISPRRSGNLKIWTLADVENLGHVLHSWHAITTRHLITTLVVVRYTAIGYEVIQ
jgi:hypothetical protein